MIAHRIMSVLIHLMFEIRHHAHLTLFMTLEKQETLQIGSFLKGWRFWVLLLSV